MMESAAPAPVKRCSCGRSAIRNRGYGRNHPLAIPRVPLTVDLIRCLRRAETRRR
ncbi:MAG: hypothetical protein MZW92_49935 [Comamonadaceae bacterium]|nr:hypothetical protein [Comamonadaceae bacterium]